MLNRIVGGIGVLWGGLMLLSAVIQIGAADFGARQVATFVLALLLFSFGGYCLIRGNKAL